MHGGAFPKDMKREGRPGRRAFMKAIVFSGLLALTSPGLSAASEDSVSHVNRWMVTEAPAGVVTPPLRLVWNKSPVITLFHWLNIGNYMLEDQNRRLVDTPYGLAVIIKRKLYIIDKRTGSTRWSLRLEGEGVLDWTVQGDTLFYSSNEKGLEPSGFLKEELRRQGLYVEGEKLLPVAIHAAVDLRRGTHLWSTRVVPDGRYVPEWVMAANGRVIFGTDVDGDLGHATLSVYEASSGRVVWQRRNDMDRSSLMRASWFVYGDYIYAVTTKPDSGGLYLQGYGLSTGEKIASVPLFGAGSTVRRYSPHAFREDGVLFQSFTPFDSDSRIFLVAYDINNQRLVWSSLLHGGVPPSQLLPMLIALGPDSGDPVLMAVSPNRIVAVDPKTGQITMKGSLAGHYQWVDHVPTLYSYPYLFTGVVKRSGNRMSYDLIALNIETGNTEWSYEIDSARNGEADMIMNFVVSGDIVYVARSDGRILAFQASSPIASQ